jgi:hypothetical protein
MSLPSIAFTIYIIFSFGCKKQAVISKYSFLLCYICILSLEKHAKPTPAYTSEEAGTAVGHQ